MSGNFTKTPFIVEIMIETCIPKTKQTDWIFYKVVYTLNINEAALKSFEKSLNILFKYV